MLLHNEKLVVLGRACEFESLALPLIGVPVRAAFPPPADDYLESELNLSEHLIQHPSATYYIRAAGESMINYGIFNGDLLIVDRSLAAKPAAWNLKREFLSKRYTTRWGELPLVKL